MVERNEKGRQTCRYFIECEKKFKNQFVDYDRNTRFDLPILGGEIMLLANSSY